MLITDELLNELAMLQRQRSDDLLEARLLRAYEEFKKLHNVEELAYVVSELAHFYAVSKLRDLKKAEAFHLELELLEPGAQSKWMTAGFYSAFGHPTQVITKVNEISSTDEDIVCRYSALSLKGQACLATEKLEEAEETLGKLRDLANRERTELPYGDELPFVEEAAKISSLRSTSRAFLELVVPRIRDEEFQEKGKRLLESIAEPGSGSCPHE